MDDISNRTLALLLVTAIVVSLGATVYTLNNIGRVRAPAGRAASDIGNVSLQVSNQVSIVLNSDTIDFGTGAVNTSCTDIQTAGKTYANLTAGSSFTDSTDCWTGATTPTSFLVENNGNLNATLYLRGPANTSFFNGYSGTNEYGIQLESRDSEAGSCVDSSFQSTWRDLSDNSTPICNQLAWDPQTADELAVDINVRIPKDLQTGTYANSTIQFYAVQGP
jgi:hypothetical protein